MAKDKSEVEKAQADAPAGEAKPAAAPRKKRERKGGPPKQRRR